MGAGRPRRVSNEDGLLVGGAPGRRVLVLFRRPSVCEDATGEPVLDVACALSRATFAVGEMHRNETGQLTLSSSAQPGHVQLLLFCALHVATIDGYSSVRSMDVDHIPRVWPLVYGMRRRGSSRWRHLTREFNLNHELAGPALSQAILNFRRTVSSTSEVRSKTTAA